MKIQVLGTGCSKCQLLAKHVEQAVRDLSLECEIEKVTDIQQIMKFGVMMTPGLAVDGKVKLVGRVPAVSELVTILATCAAEEK
jgi:small redox-active disulfide protein 2